jgi:hypothetical protein
VSHPESSEIDGQAALRTEQQAEDAPPRRPEALWPEVAPHSDPADVPGTDPDHVDHSSRP